MTWLTWRQLRAQLLALTFAAAALEAWLLGTRGRVHDLARHPATLYDSLSPTDHRLFYAGVVVLAVVPVIVGVFWGAPLVARELEDGTHRLVWSQGVTRGRWLAAKLGLTALATAVVVGGLSLAITWWSAPVDGALSRTHGSLPSRMTPVTFAMRGLVPVAWALFALTLGVLLGLLLRRVLVTMAVTLVFVVAMQIVWPLLVRPHLLPASVQTLTPSRTTFDGVEISDGGHATLSSRSPHPGDWVLSQHLVDASGRSAAVPASTVACLALPLPAPTSTPTTRLRAGMGEDTVGACITALASKGYRFRVTYLPISRFWTLQWIETGVLLALSAALAGGAGWRIRRDVG